MRNIFTRKQLYKYCPVIPPAVRARVGIEAGVELGWSKYIGDNGIFIGMSSFGASAPFKVCFEKFGITVQAAVAAAKKSLGNGEFRISNLE